MLLLRGVISHVDLRAELHLFDFNLALVLASLLCLDGLFVLELAIVHDAAYGRLSIWSNLYQIETCHIGNMLGLLGGTDTHLFPVVADQPYFTRSDGFVEPWLFRSYRKHLLLVAFIYS